MKARATRVGIALPAAAALSAVLVAYLNPHFSVNLANRVWACF
jgi:hypothetical protein